VRDACRVVAADVVGWWMDALAVQGEFVEQLFRGWSDFIVMMAIQFLLVQTLVRVWIKGFHGENRCTLPKKGF
jgi:hypothetical protein